MNTMHTTLVCILPSTLVVCKLASSMQLGGVLYELLLLEYTYELVCMVYRILPRNIIIYYAYYTCTPSSIHTECMYVCMYVCHTARMHSIMHT